MKTLSLTVLLIAALACACSAQSGYQVSLHSFNCGGSLAAGGSCKLSSSIGQSSADFVVNSANLHWAGFWGGEIPSPTVVASANQAKMLPDGAFVSVVGNIATSAHDDFAGFFYIEEESRVSGIRVASVAGAASGIQRGHIANVIGTLGTTPAGERQFTGPIVVITGSREPLRPLGMSNASVGGGDFGSPPLGQYGVAGGFGLNNVGLLIHTWGRVIGQGAGYVLIDDGSGSPVRVDTNTLAHPPALNDYVTVVGISSLHKPGGDRLRFVMPRDDSDVSF